MWHELFDLPAYSTDKIFDIWAVSLRLKQNSLRCILRVFLAIIIRRFWQQSNRELDMNAPHLRSF